MAESEEELKSLLKVKENEKAGLKLKIQKTKMASSPITSWQIDGETVEMVRDFIFLLKLKLQYFGHLVWRLTHWKRLWCWEGLGAGGEGDYRGWDGWMASPTWWTWVWVNSGSWWWTGRPGVLWFMGCKESDTTEWLNWTELNVFMLKPLSSALDFCWKWKLLSHVQLSVTPWTIQSMEFSSPEYWSG